MPLETTWPTESITRTASIASPADQTLSERVILAYHSDNWWVREYLIKNAIKWLWLIKKKKEAIKEQIWIFSRDLVRTKAILTHGKSQKEHTISIQPSVCIQAHVCAFAGAHTHTHTHVHAYTLHRATGTSVDWRIESQIKDSWLLKLAFSLSGILWWKEVRGADSLFWKSQLSMTFESHPRKQ